MNACRLLIVAFALQDASALLVPASRGRVLRTACLGPRPAAQAAPGFAAACRRAHAPRLAADESAAPATTTKGLLSRFNLKYFVLVLLVFQNSFIAILAGMSRTAKANGGPLYLGSVAVLLSELVKLPVCLGLITRDEGGVANALKAIWRQVFVQWRDTLRMSVPALCYCLQNILFFVALSNLSATSYQLWSQSKTLFTALFFVTYLGRTLTKRQWA